MILKIFGMLFLIDFLVIGISILLGANKKASLELAVKCEKLVSIFCIGLLIETIAYIVVII